MKKNMQEKVTRWSIRRLSVGVASVVVASGFFMITSPANSVLAKEGNVTPVTQTTQNKVDKEKESKSDDVNKLIKNAVDTALTNSNDSSTSPQSTENTTNKPIENKVEDRAATPAAETRTNSETPAAPVAETPTTVEETKPEQVKAAVKDNVKESIDVPAAYLEKAKGDGPFTAGVNQVIPYEFFAGDGMLTRLLLKASDNAPWSDNGAAKNPALPPLEGLTKGKYFYEVDLNGNTVGKQGQDLIDQLKANGTQTYNATVKVYSDKDGKNVVATKNVGININGVVAKETVQKAVQDNVKDSIDVPAAYLEKAEGKGPFTAGVNQVIPYEFFAGDGMLTRLLLKASDNAPWSDNGSAKNPALSPLGENVNTKGQYFYEVDLNGNTTGKEGQALLDLLRANGNHTYDATVKVYGNKDGKADLMNLIAERKVKIHLNKVLAPATTPSSSTNTSQEMNKMSTPKEDMKVNSNKPKEDMMAKESTSKQEVKPTMKEKLNKAKEEMKSPMMAHQKTTSQDMMKKDNMSTLPETGETATNTAALGAFSAAFAFILGTLGLKAKKERN